MKTKPTKPAAKKAPKLTPISIMGKTVEVIHRHHAAAMIAESPTAILKEQLRERGVPIPKDKATMVARLADWASRPEATFVLTLR